MLGVSWWLGFFGVGNGVWPEAVAALLRRSFRVPAVGVPVEVCRPVFAGPVTGPVLLRGGETMSTPDAVSSAASSLSSTLTSDATTVLPYAAGLAAITIGWRFVRRFLHI